MLLILARLGYINAGSLVTGGLSTILVLAKPGVSFIAVNEAGITVKMV